MLYYAFDLKEYFVQTKKYYYFFDGLFALEKKSKKEILDELNIPDSTYRTNRLKVFTKNNVHKFLLKHFNYNDIGNTRTNYENCLIKIFNAVYYRRLPELSFLSKELEGYILENNYLKPVFIIFKLLITITTTSNYKILLKENKAFLDYLNLFPKDYFTSELYLLASLILHYCEYREEVYELKELVVTFPNLSWFYYQIMGSYEYLHNKDYEAMVYFEKAEQFYKSDLNFTRLVAVSNNIAYIHNLHGQYELSIQYLEEVLPYAFYQVTDIAWSSYVTMHYFFASFMLKRYKEIQKFLMIYDLREETIDSITTIIGIATASKLGISLGNLCPLFVRVLSKDEEVLSFYKCLIEKNHNPDFSRFNLYFNDYFKKIIKILKLDKF